MRCKDILKLASICAATLSLVLTMKGIAQEEREADHLDMVADIEAETPEAPAEPEPTETPEPVIYAIQEEETREPEPAVMLDAADEEILLKLAMSEAGGESTEGKALVMLSVVNRVRSDEFPDTVSEVVYESMTRPPIPADRRVHEQIKTFKNKGRRGGGRDEQIRETVQPETEHCTGEKPAVSESRKQREVGSGDVF